MTGEVVPEAGHRPGWYADPSGEFEWRWWRGQTRTTHTAATPGYVPGATRLAQLAAEARIADKRHQTIADKAARSVVIRPKWS